MSVIDIACAQRCIAANALCSLLNFDVGAGTARVTEEKCREWFRYLH